MSTPTTAKAEARRIIEQLPDDSSWEDLIYHLSVRRSIEAGLKDVQGGRTHTTEEVRQQFGLPA